MKKTVHCVYRVLPPGAIAAIVQGSKALKPMPSRIICFFLPALVFFAIVSSFGTQPNTNPVPVAYHD
jgi:hypothetical protein